MKKSRFTGRQTMAVLKHAEAGKPVLDLCREMAKAAVAQHGMLIRLTRTACHISETC